MFFIFYYYDFLLKLILLLNFRIILLNFNIFRSIIYINDYVVNYTRKGEKINVVESFGENKNCI